MRGIPPGGNEAGDGAALGTVVDEARGLTGRRLAWVVGGILGAVGVVMTTTDLLQHHHGIGPYLLAAAFLLLLLATLDMWSVERSRRRKATRTMRRLSARVDRQQEYLQHTEHDRDQNERIVDTEVRPHVRLRVRLLNYMHERSLTECVPRNNDDAPAASTPLLGLTSGYIRRSAHLLPKQGTTYPWKVHQSYLRDYRAPRRKPSTRWRPQQRGATK